jgi:tetratricopeptide (TPR) repeat protein
MSEKENNAINALIETEGKYRTGRDNADPAAMENALSGYMAFRTSMADQERFREFYFWSEYKLGWSYFRKFEFTGDHRWLESAQKSFDKFANEAPDSIKYLGLYMGGEARIWIGANQKYLGFLGSDSDPCKGDNGRTNSEVRGYPTILNEARAKFEAVINDRFSETEPVVRMAAGLRARDVYYEIARYYLLANDNVNALGYYRKIKYGELQNGLANIEDPTKSALKKILEYSEWVISLDTSIIHKELVALKQASDALTAFSFSRDINLRKGIVAMALGDERNTIVNLTAAEQDGVAEASYWKGYALMMTGEYRQAELVLTTFLGKTNNTDPRMVPLRQKAGRLKALLDFAYGSQTQTDQLGKLTYEDAKIILRMVARSLGTGGEAIARRVEPLFRDPGKFCGGSDEATFYRGLLLSLRAEAAGAGRAESAFAEAAEVLKNVGGNFSREASYMRARALFWANRMNEAKSLFQELALVQRSPRALFYLGEIYSEDTAYNCARRCYTPVLNALGQNKSYADYSLWRNKADAALGQCGTAIDNACPIPLGFEARYPDELCTLTIGGRKEIVSYETVQDFGAVASKFKDECLEQFKAWGLPKMSIYPGKLLRNSAITSMTLKEVSVPLREDIPLNTKWNLYLKVVRESDKSPVRDCIVISDGDTLRYEDGYYIGRPIDASQSLALRISHHEYYTKYLTLPSQGIGKIYKTTMITARVKYGPCSDKTTSFVSLTRPGLDSNTVIVGCSSEENCLPAKLIQDFNTNIYLRDLWYDRAALSCLVVDCRSRSGLIKYSADGSSSDFSLFGETAIDSLNLPEGLAVDDSGNIYIADWGNNRTVIFNKDGGVHGRIDSLDWNNPEEGAQWAGLLFPTRIAVEEDTTAITIDSDTIRSDKYILVADWYGIHKFDSQGHYLDTPVPVSDSLPAGSFYAFTIEGYGSSSKIILWNRTAKKYQVFCPSEGKY